MATLLQSTAASRPNRHLSAAADAATLPLPLCRRRPETRTVRDALARWHALQARIYRLRQQQLAVDELLWATLGVEEHNALLDHANSFRHFTEQPALDQWLAEIASTGLVRDLDAALVTP